jgi:hypothetical protein
MTGTAAESTAAPDGVVEPGDEHKLDPGVQAELARLRADHGHAYGFGACNPGDRADVHPAGDDAPDFVTWRLAAPGDVVYARDPGELREFLAARPS